MKTRIGFVSNSSSSSFIIALKDVTKEQVEQIRNHSALGKEMGMAWAELAWEIDVTDTQIRGWTVCDNFSIGAFFRKIGIGTLCPHCGETLEHSMSVVEWDGGHFWKAPWDDTEDTEDEGVSD